MSIIIESGWPLGWIPSASDKNIGGEALGLLRMDNLTIDEVGTLRLAKSAKIESNIQFTLVTSIFGAYVGGRKLRYLYNGLGAASRNYSAVGANTLDIFDLSIFGVFGSPPLRAAFLNALGHILIIAGPKKYKDRGDVGANVVFPLGIDAPANPPVLTLVTSPNLTIDLSVAYTSIESASFSAIGTTGATFTPNVTTLRGVIQSVSASTFDITNLGGTGYDTPDDVFYFNFEIDDADLLSYVKIEFYNDQSPTINYFWKEWDFKALTVDTINARVAVGLGPFNISSGVTQVVSVLRSEFTHVGADATKDWTNIKAIRVTVGVSASTSITFDALKVKGGDTGPLSGEQSYVVVEVRDTGQYLEFSPASAVATINAQSQAVHLVYNHATSIQTTQLWYFRKDDITGDFIAVHKDIGSEGFNPGATGFDDKLSDDDALISAAINPQYLLEPYRTALPDTIIGMIYFRDRVIYLTLNGFIPSYKLDPGSYDSRFVYELSSTTSETCLFIVKIDVGTFIIATTRDFYRVNGTFSNLTDSSTDVTIQDVNIYPLGISDPAIDRNFVEVEGSIIYISSSGIRSLSNTSSTLLNGSLDLLFKNENRYDIEPIVLTPAVTSVTSMATQGNRTYFSLPYFNGTNISHRLFVHTLVSGKSHWRLLTDTSYNNIFCMFREEDGVIITAGVSTDYIRSIENDISSLPIHLKTQYNYGGVIDALKEVSIMAMLINTGGVNITLIVSTLLETGGVATKSYVFNTTGEILYYIDLKSDLKEALAYSIDISGIVSIFSLKYFMFDYDIRPQLVLNKRLLAPVLNGKMGRKSITAWPFRINPRGGNVYAEVLVDGTTISDVSHTQSFTGSYVATFEWLSASAKYGTNWEIYLYSTTPFEFFEFLAPIIVQESPTAVKRIKIPFNAFGKGGRKTIATWPFRINLLLANIYIIVRGDSSILPTQSINGGTDIISIQRWISSTNALALAWEIEVISNNGEVFEFYEFLDPVISQEMPVATLRTILSGTNFGEDARKLIGQIPFRINPLGATLTLTMKIDGVFQTQQVINNTDFTIIDYIKTLEWVNLSHTIGIDYELELVASGPIEFYEWMGPIILEKFPPKTYYAIVDYSDLGKAVLKKLSVWPFLVYTFGHAITAKVSKDGSLLSTDTLSSNDIRTLYWRNTQDVNGIDWKLELNAPSGMELHKIDPPDIIQVYPIGRLIDQVGPLDFSGKGLISEFSIRIMNEGTTFHYKIYAQDDLIYENDIITQVLKDEVFTEKVPKGIDPLVCRLVITSNTVFYRYYVEFKVTITGKDTELKYIMVK